MPAAYLIGQIDVHDPESYANYTAQTPGTVQAFGGEFIVRAGQVEHLEGEAPLPRVVVIKFPSFDAAKAWYDSEAYQAILPIRQAASSGHAFIVEGAD